MTYFDPSAAQLIADVDRVETMEKLMLQLQSRAVELEELIARSRRASAVTRVQNFENDSQSRQDWALKEPPPALDPIEEKFRRLEREQRGGSHE